ncbi:ImmA/IrrE family metallo-endopeptidase [Streptomyces sp. NPDC046977]|uniref:ImmA/IrrE family metallo-endopeptidase n=1 Tax=Streptomyces sp. NPDC046977 TaxID=3154703 RepID=UPI0033EC7F98
MALRRGFKAEANRLSVLMRKELGLGPTAALSPTRLAEHLDIPVRTFSAAAAADPRVGALLGSEREAVSALTVHLGPRRMIWVNDSHDESRQNSSIGHELAHALLQHPAGPALDARGCRHWDGEIEDEASWLSGALLITNEAAWSIARRQMADHAAMLRYGVSRQMLTWRLNASGAAGQRKRSA